MTVDDMTLVPTPEEVEAEAGDNPAVGQIPGTPASWRQRTSTACTTISASLTGAKDGIMLDALAQTLTSSPITRDKTEGGSHHPRTSRSNGREPLTMTSTLCWKI